MRSTRRQPSQRLQGLGIRAGHKGVEAQRNAELDAERQLTHALQRHGIREP
jgi:hypothetical protein